jgi:hypothetical protein
VTHSIRNLKKSIMKRNISINSNDETKLDDNWRNFLFNNGT